MCVKEVILRDEEVYIHRSLANGSDTIVEVRGML